VDRDPYYDTPIYATETLTVPSGIDLDDYLSDLEDENDASCIDWLVAQPDAIRAPHDIIVVEI